MGQLINGKWEATDEVQPQPSVHAHALGSAEFPFDKSTPQGRYRLYVAKSCPFAQRAEIALHLKGLYPQIAVSVLHPVQNDEGWRFVEPDEATGARQLYEVYAKADPSFTGRVTVPLLYDTKTNSIVNKESADITANFAEISTHGPDLLANGEKQAAASGFFGEFLGAEFRVGQAEDQQSYDEAIAKFYAVVEKIEAHLATSKFLAGETVTKVDVLTFPAFELFEAGIGAKMLITGNRLRDYPHFDKYLRRFYQLPGVSEAIDVEQIRESAFAEVNKLKFFKAKKEHIRIAQPKLDWDVPV